MLDVNEVSIPQTCRCARSSATFNLCACAWALHNFVMIFSVIQLRHLTGELEMNLLMYSRSVSEIALPNFKDLSYSSTCLSFRDLVSNSAGLEAARSTEATKLSSVTKTLKT